MTTVANAVEGPDGGRTMPRRAGGGWRRMAWIVLPIVASAAAWDVLDREGAAIAAMPVRIATAGEAVPPDRLPPAPVRR
ncbi:hypothetical protein ASG29_03890 [Sphingomonas sp. Leaf412]|uniref:hypothetical protein n=1 Tax=Sphingomonas sp. Leaf412 TaxID=1736370 RepID=UPI0006F1D749|nr:hypothetical protein [Sphingomonas sp. Leaf412]KQT35257.1 hypothetical protein ASG29_03890 [Sphingomonas sp. Leaf412]